MSDSKIYALFIAINSYPNHSHLEGCLQDSTNLLAYIKEAAKAQKRSLYYKKLEDEEATKENIVLQISQFFDQAGKDDICLIYFSGHGGLEEAHPAFRDNTTDNKLEVLVCYDSHSDKRGSFLANKELRYLIYHLYKKTAAHIALIFDCCHSGNNTKADLNVRQIRKPVQYRLWDEFIFGKDIPEEKIQSTKALDNAIPQGEHIQLAACGPKQKAIEVKNGGIFTTELIALLQQTKNDLNYKDLVSILNQKISEKYNQNPCYYTSGDKNLEYHSFLGDITSLQNNLVNASYFEAKNCWKIDIGAVHGITRTNHQLNLELKSNNYAEILSIHPTYTLVKFEAAHQLNQDKFYKVKIRRLSSNKLNFVCLGEAQSYKTIYQHYLNKKLQQVFNINRLGTAKANYYIDILQNKYTILSAKNKLPLVQSIHGSEPENIELLLQFLKSIHKWNFVKELDSQEKIFDANFPIEINIYRKENYETEKKLLIEDNKAIIYSSTAQQNERQYSSNSSILICLKNTGNLPFHVALLYLSQDFGIIPNLIEEGTMELAPNEEIWAMGGKPIPFEQASYIDENWECETHYLKIIICSEYFNISSFKQEGLPTPNSKILPYFKSNRGEKAINKFENKGVWKSKLIELNFPNPHFKGQ